MLFLLNIKKLIVILIFIIIILNFIIIFSNFVRKFFMVIVIYVTNMQTITFRRNYPAVFFYQRENKVISNKSTV